MTRAAQWTSRVALCRPRRHCVAGTRGLELGAVDYITVPTDPTELSRMIERAAQGQLKRFDQ
jgi:DNA-binding response OmpR family regulator